MLFKRLVREQPESVFVVVQNNTGSGTALVKDQALMMDTGTAQDGVKVKTPATDGLYAFVGVCDAALADQDFGLAQVYGYRSSSIIRTTSSSASSIDGSGLAGTPLMPIAAASYLAQVTTTFTSTANFTRFPIVGVLMSSVVSTTASATVSAPIFLRCL